jgi:integrase
MTKRITSVFSRGEGKKKSWWARLRYIDEDGTHHDLQRKAASKADARELGEQLAKDHDQSGGRVHRAERMTFNDLAAYCEKHYYKRAEYKDERKIAGVRGFSTAKAQIKVLKAYFGKRRLRLISYADLRNYRAHRLQTKSERTDRELSIATVNRELSCLRRMLNVALAEGWIIRNPFNQGAPLISAADERKRERILTRDEEKKLLEACSERQRLHLRPLLIAALDTGMRRGELLKLQWSKVDLDNRVIHVKASHTKTLTDRDVPISQRLAAELRRLWEVSPKQEGLVFGIKDNARMSFTSARSDAGLADVRFHDLRHTAATRLVQQGLSLAEVGRILGHSQPTTTYRYVNPDGTTLQRAAEALDAFHAEQEKKETVSEMVN